MANKYAVSSGAWSSTATWSDTDGGAGGATVPADGDAVFISEGVSVKMDVDLSAYTGLLDVTVRGGATPGMLYWMNGTSGYLKIQTGCKLIGTTNTNKGRLLANSDGDWSTGTPLAYADKAVIDLQGTAKFQADDLDIRFFCAQPLFKYARISGAVSSGTNAIPVLDDVSGDLWAVGDSVVLSNYGDYDVQRTTISAIAASAITLSDAADSNQSEGATILLMSRNISILAESPQSYQGIVQNTKNCILGCEIRAGIPGSSYGTSAYALSSSSSNTIFGTISGCRYALSSSSSNTISGTISGCDRALYSSSSDTFSGTISGCNYALHSSSSNTISGTISGCNYALYSSSSNTISGTISGCNYALYSSSSNTISGTISGCNYALSSSSSNTIFGTISGCNYDLYSPSGLTTARSALLPAALSWGGRNSSGSSARVTIENSGRVSGADRIEDMFGTISRVTCGDGGTIPATDPDGGTTDCFEVWDIQSNCSADNPLKILDDLRIWLEPGSYVLRFKMQTTFSGGFSAGGLILSAQYLSTGGELVTVVNDDTAISTAADWSQGMEVSFTQAVEGWANVNLTLYEYSTGRLYIWATPVIS